LLALWKVERKQLKNIITVVIKCSLEIHGLFEAKEAEEGLDIRVKIGKDPERIMMVYACNLNSQEPEAGGSLRV
jgi:adenylate cyclase 10